MGEARELLYQKEWRVIDQSVTGLHLDPLQSFGMDDTLCASVGTLGAPATARAWVHQNTIVLGIQDTRLPFLADGLAYLKEQNYHTIVRNSGGLAVVLDEGVLNLSLIFPEKEKGIDINRGYEAMFLLIKEMFADFNVSIEAREIMGSYCPGSYDLSISGKKFAGISQRRIRNGVAVQIYLCISDSGSKRAEIIQNFYSLSKGQEETKFKYPEINPSVMESLAGLLGVDLTIQDVMLRFLQVLKKRSDSFYMGQLTEEEWPLFEEYYQRIVERNEKTFGSL